jgi:hypothetical protein
MRAAIIGALAGALSFPAVVGSAQDKGNKPRLDLRASPRFAFSPASINLTAELIGGTNIESFHCPELEWDWDDGGKSAHEEDCDPLETGTEIQRRFTAAHEYRKAGTYNVSLTMRRGEKTLAKQTVKITVRPGLGDRASDPGNE